MLAVFLAEALLFGIVAAAPGVALGRLLAGATVKLIADTVNALYTTSRPTPIVLTWSETWIGLVFVVKELRLDHSVSSPSRGLYPARVASRLHPIDVVHEE